jgi:Ca2+-binding RTX toxin-like protein
VAHITSSTSVDQPSGNAFEALAIVPDSLIVDADAFLISETSGNGADLSGAAWTVIVNGQIKALGGFANDGLEIHPGSATDVESVTIGRHGLISGYIGVSSDGMLSLTNKGTISGGFIAILADGKSVITNAGTIDGHVFLHGDDDIFTDFKKVGKVIKNGTLLHSMDLGDGVDHFFGGSHSETVQDGGGADSYKFGGGYDIYLAVKDLAAGADGADLVSGGKGKDTYDATSATFTVLVNLDTKAHGGLAVQSAQGANVGELGNADKVIGFENAIGGSAADALYGSGAANVLSGGAGTDELHGLGGRDILTGGANADTFFFAKLSDSGVVASTRDVITDFFASEDHIDLTALEAQVHHHFSFSVPRHHAGRLTEKISGEKSIVFLDANGDGKADFSPGERSRRAARQRFYSLAEPLLQSRELVVESLWQFGAERCEVLLDHRQLGLPAVRVDLHQFLHVVG